MEAWWRHNTTCMETNVQNDSGRRFLRSCATNGLTIMSKHILRPCFLHLVSPAGWRRQSSAIWMVPVTWTTSVDRPTNCDCLMHAVSQVFTYINPLALKFKIRAVHQVPKLKWRRTRAIRCITVFNFIRARDDRKKSAVLPMSGRKMEGSSHKTSILLLALV